MISSFLWIMNYVREEILEKFILPEIGISYWEFCIYLAIAAIVITLLINSIKVSSQKGQSAGKSNKNSSSKAKGKS